jgi:hypothetical protein
MLESSLYRLYHTIPPIYIYRSHTLITLSVNQLERPRAVAISGERSQGEDHGWHVVHPLWSLESAGNGGFMGVDR